MAWHCDTSLSLWVCSCVCTLQAWQRATFLQLQKIGTIPVTLHSCHKNFRLQYSVLQNSRPWGKPKSANNIWYMSFHPLVVIHFDNQPSRSVFKPSWMSSSTNSLTMIGSNKVTWFLQFIFHLLKASTRLLLFLQKGEWTILEDGVGFTFSNPSLCSFNRPPNPYFISCGSQNYNHS